MSSTDPADRLRTIRTEIRTQGEHLARLVADTDENGRPTTPTTPEDPR